ncbi:hypothetical protein LI328DRAFT_125235 [Trichoderma asperelloides]|nr:hypothetical protein LI328DRAFT_125235 [Trichoderma asperelloides]
MTDLHLSLCCLTRTRATLAAHTALLLPNITRTGVTICIPSSLSSTNQKTRRWCGGERETRPCRGGWLNEPKTQYMGDQRMYVQVGMYVCTWEREWESQEKHVKPSSAEAPDKTCLNPG